MGLIQRIVTAVFKPLARADQRIKPYRRKINDSRVGDASAAVTKRLIKPFKKADDYRRRKR